MTSGGLFDQLHGWVSALLFGLVMVGSWAAGWWIGRRPRGGGDSGAGGEPPGEKFSDASFALLGLLLAFAFGMSLQKHGDRRAMVVAESNAIGDFYTCATLLEDPPRAKLQSVIRDYAELHLTAARDDLDGAALQKVLDRFEDQVSEMTDLTRQAVNGGSPVAVPLTNTLNEVTSMKASRIFAIEDRLPTSVVVLLFVSGAAAMLLAGRRHAALGGNQWLGVLSMATLLSLVVYVILDLNQPRRGLVQVSQAPMERLVASMKR